MTSPWFVKIYQNFRVLLTIPRTFPYLSEFFRNSVNSVKVPCFVNNTTDISILIGIFRNSVNSVKVPCFVNNTTDISVLIGIFRNSVKVPCFVNLPKSQSDLFIDIFGLKVGNVSTKKSEVFTSTE